MVTELFELISLTGLQSSGDQVSTLTDETLILVTIAGQSKVITYKDLKTLLTSALAPVSNVSTYVFTGSGSIVLELNDLITNIVVISENNKTLTVETSSGAGDIYDAEPITGGIPEIITYPIYVNSTPSNLLFSAVGAGSFTVKIYKEK